MGLNRSLPEPPHNLDQLTTSELTSYENQLADVLKEPVDGQLYMIIMKRLGDVTEQWAARRRIRNPHRWPIHN